MRKLKTHEQQTRLYRTTKLNKRFSHNLSLWLQVMFYIEMNFTQMYSCFSKVIDKIIPI